jgi:hypothetical protein
MPSLSFGAPVVPGKTNAGRELTKVSMGEKKKDFIESRSSIGVVRETVALYATPQGDVVAVYLEANDPVWANQQFAASKKPFDVWFKTKAQEALGIDFNQPLPRIEQVFEARIGTPTPQNIMPWMAPILPGKTPAARAFFKEISTTRAKDYLASMLRGGKTHETVDIMTTPMGDVTAGVTEAANLPKAVDHVSKSSDPYDVWYRGKLVEIFGLDLAKNPFPQPEILMDWQWR